MWPHEVEPWSQGRNPIGTKYNIFFLTVSSIWPGKVETLDVNIKFHSMWLCFTPTISNSYTTRDLPQALDLFQPDIVVYNAGTDILKGDPLGALDITPKVRPTTTTYIITRICEEDYRS